MDSQFKIWYGDRVDQFFMANWSCLVSTRTHNVMTSYGEIQCKVGGTDPFLYSLEIEVIFKNKIIINAILRTFYEGSRPGFKMTIVNHDRELFTFDKTSIVDYDFVDAVDIDYMLEEFIEFVKENCTIIEDDDDDDDDDGDTIRDGRTHADLFSNPAFSTRFLG